MVNYLILGREAREGRLNAVGEANATVVFLYFGGRIGREEFSRKDG
jgi:hypothetical protein